MISETENDDFELSEVVVVAEELELPDELSFLAQELKNRLKQQQYKIILDIFFIMLPPILSDYGRHTGGTQRNGKTKNQRKSTKNSSKQERMTKLDTCGPSRKQSAEGTESIHQGKCKSEGGALATSSVFHCRGQYRGADSL